MKIEDINTQLKKKGYCIVRNVISEAECQYAYKLFHDWKNSIENHDQIHDQINPHGIYKYHEAGHTRHAWYLRTHPNIQNIFKQIWKTNELIVSFDGCCYISKNCRKKDNCWTHSDQAPTSEGLKCYQGYVSLTNNEERTFVVYEGTHLVHYEYFKRRGINNSKNWNLIPSEDLECIKNKRKVLNVTRGSLVIWDSRIFHQNQYGKPNSEERIVQYICYLPKNHSSNNKKMREKRKRYFDERRTTSHWPVPVRVNGKQPQTFGNRKREINYASLTPPNLGDLLDKINKLI